MRKYILCLLAVLISHNLVCVANDDNWHISKSTHFVVYYKAAQEGFVQELIDKSEDY